MLSKCRECSKLCPKELVMQKENDQELYITHKATLKSSADFEEFCIDKLTLKKRHRIKPSCFLQSCITNRELKFVKGRKLSLQVMRNQRIVKPN